MVGSRLKVISSEARNRFMPDNKDCGLYMQLHVSTPIEAIGKKKADHSRSGGGRNSRLTLEHDDSICEIRCHDEIVLDNESGLLSV